MQQASEPIPDHHPTERLRLGDIVYSNCFPVHARLIDRPASGDPLLVSGVPSYLNALLERGEIDVSPSSSIEYARHADRYRIIPNLVIGARGPVGSIVFLSDRDPDRLDGATVALPTASATSVVLLKILLRARWGARPTFRWFDQAGDDPFAGGAAAALFIGDIALRHDLHPAVPVRLDLGAEWFAHTGLPFAFAVWQAASGTDAGLRELHRRLVDSRAYFAAHHRALADRHARRFGLSADRLDRYWSGLTYTLDPEMVRGLTAYYQLAAEIGEIAAAPELRWCSGG